MFKVVQSNTVQICFLKAAQCTFIDDKFRPLERRSVTSGNYGSKISGSPVNDNRTTTAMATSTAKKTPKKQEVYISKTTTSHLHHAFLHISQPSMRDSDMKLSNTGLLYKVAEHNPKTFFSFFCKIDTPKILPAFDKLNEID